MHVWIVPIFIYVAVWLRGRGQRKLWEDRIAEPRVFPYLGAGRAPKTFFVTTGAFNGPPHTRRMIRELQIEGAVHVFDYPLLRFSLVRAVFAVWTAVRVTKGRKILVGWSLGGLVMFLVLLLAYASKDYEEAEDLELIIGDAPLGVRHLLLPDGKGTKIPPLLMKRAGLLRFIARPGPVVNLLSRVVTKNAFVEVPADQRETGTDETQLREHMQFLRSNKLSLMADQILAIVLQPEHSVQGWRNRVTYLQCGRQDVVIDAEAALQGWRQHFPHLDHRVVEGAQHVSLVEAHEAYLAAMRPAFK